MFCNLESAEKNREQNQGDKVKEYFVGNCAACKKPMYRSSEDMRLKIRPEEWLKHEEEKIVFLNGLGYHRDCLLSHVKFPSKPVSFTNHSIRDLPQQAIIKGHMITVVSRVGRMKVNEFSFPIVDWLMTARHPNPNWAKQALLQKLNNDMDFTERILGAQMGAIDTALKLYTEPISRIKNPDIYWHGTASGNLRGGTRGLHVGTYQAATQALQATIGVPATGVWDGTREYGKTLLMGKKRMWAEADKGNYLISGYNCDAPEGDYYPNGKAKFSNGEKIPLTMKPSIFKVRIIGPMTNSISSAYPDGRANGLMARQLKLGNAKRGFYYVNIGEDDGSISAVVPSQKHLEILHKNPNDYNLRQYTIGEDGTATFVAKIKIELHAKHKNAILEYMDWLLKLPGVTLRIRQDRGSGLRLRWKDTETEGHEKPMRDIDIFIDADSNRYTLTNDVINDVLEDFDSRITDRVTLMQFLDEDTGGAWQGNNLVLYAVTVTSKSMRRLNAFMQSTWPTAESKDQLRYHRDPKQRRYIDTDFGVWLFLDGPEPKFVNSYNLPWSMNPIRHTAAGWYWGSVGPQPTRGRILRQMKAIFASGYHGH